MSQLCKCPKLSPIQQRAFYLGGAAFLYAVLAGLLVGVFNAPVTEGADNHRFEECALQGASPGQTCIAATEADKEQNQTIFGIAIASLVVNLLMVVALLVTMSSPVWTDKVFKSQMVFEAINVGLFIGILGWFDASEDINAEANLENNVFFNELNPYAVAVAGVVLSVLDLLVFNGVRIFYFGAKCDVSF